MFFCVVLFFCVVFVLFFIKISKFALPGVMLMYERSSIDRKKERRAYGIISCTTGRDIGQSLSKVHWFYFKINIIIKSML